MVEPIIIETLIQILTYAIGAWIVASGVILIVKYINNVHPIGLLVGVFLVLVGILYALTTYYSSEIISSLIKP